MWPYIVAGGLALWVLGSIFGDGKKTKTTRRYKNFWGNKVKDETYHDTGRRMKQVTRSRLLGGTVTDTYEVEKGHKKCFRCGALVAPDGDGTYDCCGKTFY